MTSYLCLVRPRDVTVKSLVTPRILQRFLIWTWWSISAPTKIRPEVRIRYFDVVNFDLILVQFSMSHFQQPILIFYINIAYISFLHFVSTWGTHTHGGTRRHLRGYVKTSYINHNVTQEPFETLHGIIINTLFLCNLFNSLNVDYRLCITWIIHQQLRL
jgi:hypothetical protein